MKRSPCRCVVLFLLVSPLFLFLFSPAPGEASPLIRLANYQFDPLVSEPSPPPGLSAKALPSSGAAHCLLQFSGPVREEWKEECRKAGVEFLDYIPDFAFIVRLPAERAARVKALPVVRWLGAYQPAYRIAPCLLESSAAAKGGNEELIVVLFKGISAEGVISRIEGEGGEVIRRTEAERKVKLRVRLPPDKIKALAAIEGVKWIEKAPVWVFFNNRGTSIVQARGVWNTKGFLGAGQVVGVADSGLDRGDTDPDKLHADFLDATGTSRMLAISNWSSGTADIIGHGTHVSGTILGNGACSGSDPSIRSYPSTCYAGVAPEASLVVQNLSSDLGDLAGVPDDLNVLFAQAYAGGARIHNDSWGAIGAGEYDSYSEDVDEYSWSNRDFLIVFAAGNSGVDGNFDGVVDLFSVGPPATAKNCISVGATENNRPPNSSPEPAYKMTYGWYWFSDYPANPITNDYISNKPNGLAAFSSRGSELDARFKPELVAPGTNVVSARTSAVLPTELLLWGKGGLSDEESYYYVFSGGTSMAAPFVSGAAALVGQYYTDEMGIDPSAALIKATLINGARDISPGQYGTGATQEIPDPPRPNNVEGWGRIDLSSTIFSVSPLDFYYFDVIPGLYTGEVDQYAVPVSSSPRPLSVTLVWTDHPGSTPAEGPLVNDLDLKVTGPDGSIYYANRATLAGPIYYDDGSAENVYHGDENFIEAVRFTPSCYPATVERAMFYLTSPDHEWSKTYEYRIYRGSGGAPGALIASGTSVLRRNGWHIIDLSGLGATISSGDFFLAIVMPDDDLSWGVDVDEPIEERSWEWSPMSGWYNLLTRNYLFRAVVSCPTDYDRINNVEGIDVNSPSAGTYTVEVSAYNAPYGPQPYALVVSRPSHGALPARLVLDSGDYNGDGVSDIAVFRPDSGMWSIRDLGRYYFGTNGDYPTSGDYNGDGTADLSVFRPDSGMWAVRGLSRVYFGQTGDIPVPADYDGDGRTDYGIFREDHGLWRIRNITQLYLGKAGDFPVPGDYEGAAYDGKADPTIFRASSGLWVVSGFSRFYWGSSGDFPAPADYDPFPGDDFMVFRPSTGQWLWYGYSVYSFGLSGDKPVPADYDGNGIDEMAIFRGAAGLWAVRGGTRVYFGLEGDLPVTR